MKTLYTIDGLEKLADIVRKARGDLSYRQFQEITGVSHATITRIEKCLVKEPEVTTLTKLAPFTAYNLEELIAIAQGNAESAQVRKFRIVEDVWPMVEILPDEERARLAKKIIDSLLNH